MWERVRMNDPRNLDRTLEALARRSGAARAVVASHDGLLLAGAGASRAELEELAAYAPSQLPQRLERPAGLAARRFEVEGERFYVAMVGQKPSAEVAAELARRLLP